MRLILRSDIGALGKKGDIVEVNDGYARNFLLPKGMALVASDGAVAQAAAMRRSRDLKDATEKASAQEIARRLVPITITVKARAGSEGRLFGSVTTSEIAEAVEAQAHVSLDRKKINLKDPIKTVGSHQVPVKLHTEVEFTLNVEVAGG